MKYNLNTLSSNGVKQFLPSGFDIMPIPEDLKDHCVMILQRIELLSNQIGELICARLDDPLRDRRYRQVQQCETICTVLPSGTRYFSILRQGEKRQGKQSGESLSEVGFHSGLPILRYGM
jgi:hypothetical protein